jgi:hypothetical protein
MKRAILHFPFKINKGRAAASQLRPINIIEAFKSLDIEVFLIEGYGKQRKQQIAAIKDAVKSGVRFDFLYSECSTLPTLLTEKHHYPTYPFLDFSFFNFCNKNKIPIGLFYRDIYWCFQNRDRGLIKRIRHFFHMYDLYEYNKYVSALFVPSKEMIKKIPFKFNMPIYELYPGCIKRTFSEKGDDSSIIRIVYVGGIGGYYDIKMFVESIRNNSNYSLTICTRKDDWDLVKSDYIPLLSDNISIVHLDNNNLHQLYSQSDLSCMFFKPYNYSEFAVPYKLFESIGYYCPIVAPKETWVGKYVDREGIGFTCNYNKESLNKLLQELVLFREHISDCRRNIIKIASNNTWQNRCKNIMEILSKSSK